MICFSTSASRFCFIQKPDLRNKIPLACHLHINNLKAALFIAVFFPENLKSRSFPALMAVVYFKINYSVFFKKVPAKSIREISYICLLYTSDAADEL